MRKLILLTFIFLSLLANGYSQIELQPLTINGEAISQCFYKGCGSFYALTDSGFYKTNDYAKTWNQLLLCSHYNFCVDTVSGHPDKILVYYGNVDRDKPRYISTDGGDHWEPFIGDSSTYFAFGNNAVYSIHPVHTGNIMGRNIMGRTTNNGSTWSYVYSTGEDCKGIYINKTRNIFYVINDTYGFDGLINSVHFSQSANDGQSWTNIHQWDNTGYFVGGSIKVGDMICINYNFGDIFFNTATDEKKTFNNGLTGACSIDKLGNYYITKCCNDAAILISSNKGSTWERKALNIKLSDYSNNLFLDDYGCVYVSDLGSGTLKSKDPLYKYLSNNELSLNYTPGNDTSYRKVTIYNPSYRSLSFDSIIVNKPGFFIKDFTPANVLPGDSIQVTFGYTSTASDTPGTTASIHIEWLTLELKLKTMLTEVRDKELSFNYILSQNYPNPFNPTTKIEYQLPSRCSVKLSIMNILGQEIRTLVDETKDKGSYSTQFSSDNLPSGVYMYRLQAGEYNSVKKMILMK